MHVKLGALGIQHMRCDYNMRAELFIRMCNIHDYSSSTISRIFAGNFSICCMYIVYYICYAYEHIWPKDICSNITTGHKSVADGYLKLQPKKNASCIKMYVLDMIRYFFFSTKE